MHGGGVIRLQGTITQRPTIKTGSQDKHAE